MERSAWTDEHLDDRFDEIGRRFDRVDREIADLRTEMREGFAQLRSEITIMRSDHSGQTETVRTEFGGQIEALRQTMIRFGGGMLLGFISVLAAILARGA
ncbi:MAG: hypothetical protein ACRDK5_04325 [Solirubrobacterales bacterium]